MSELMLEKSKTALDRLKPMEGSSLVRRDVLQKSGHGVVTDNYRTEASFPTIKNYYDQEFAKGGWRFKSEEKFKVWNKEVGAIQISYCKENLKGYFYFVGSQYTKDNITYTLGVSWDTDDCQVGP